MHRVIHGILYDEAQGALAKAGPGCHFEGQREIPSRLVRDDNPPTLSFRAERGIFLDARHEVVIQSEPLAPLFSQLMEKR